MENPREYPLVREGFKYKVPRVSVCFYTVFFSCANYLAIHSKYQYLNTCMDADLIYYRRLTKLTTDGREIDIRMDLFRIPSSDADKYPGSVKFSWIAFERENPERFVLFDSHPPKGPHAHTPGGEEVLLSWTNLEEMENRFFKAIETHFGSLKG